mmetsp:Transcript_1539/g.2511  ORF Transcript_1539/g.2511 Transcript_1539/m.2511 type:complete len:153 (-) Transcript_1539:92-550(-)
MFVLGPKTNKLFTHSILQNKTSDQLNAGDISIVKSAARISLTMRDVATFKHLKTGRLYGKGVQPKSVDEVLRTTLAGNTLFFVGFCSLSAFVLSKKHKAKAIGPNSKLLLIGSLGVASSAFSFLRNLWYKSREERRARDFFSKSSATGTKYL